MDDVPAVPLCVTILDTGMLVEIAPDSWNGITCLVPLSPEQVALLRSVCPDEDDAGEEWKQ